MFDAQITSHETTLDTLTDAERAELNAWFDRQQHRNAWQDAIDSLQQGQDDQLEWIEQPI